MRHENETTGLGAGMEVGDAIYRRRSVRRFDRERKVPDELLRSVLDAGRWAPSSCNLQTWDFVVVDDDALREQLATETRSVLVAPVAVFVIYDRELAREGLANVQSASAAIMNMLLRATSLGLASLWVNALGSRERVRELLGVPDDFEVLALVCLGYAKDAALPPAPERREFDDVVHRNRYHGKGGLPKSPDPDAWTLADLALYFKRKLQSGTRYNKPRLAFVEPVLAAIRGHVGPPVAGLRLLDVLSCTGLFTELLVKAYPDAAVAVMEISAENHFFADRRCGSRLAFVPFPGDRADEILAGCAEPGAKVAVVRESGGLPVMPRVLPRPRLAPGPFDVATITFRLEGLPSTERVRLLREVAALLAPQGRIVLTYTSRRSWHWPAYALRRRLGRNSVETSPVPEPNLIGPYAALPPAAVRRLAGEAGLQVVAETRRLPLPDLDALLPRLRRGGALLRVVGRALVLLNAAFQPIEPLLQPFARVRSACLIRK